MTRSHIATKQRRTNDEPDQKILLGGDRRRPLVVLAAWAPAPLPCPVAAGSRPAGVQTPRTEPQTGANVAAR